MKLNYRKKFSALLSGLMVIGVLFTLITNQANAQTTRKKYYPDMQPSSYYVLPGGYISFRGRDFAPNEKIVITSNGTTVATATTTASGKFNSDAVKIPYSYGRKTYRATGQNSSASNSKVITVATPTPVVLLDNYYQPEGASLKIEGYFYGAKENIHVSIDNIETGQTATDNQGHFSIAVNVPEIVRASSVKVVAYGEETGAKGSALLTINRE